MAGATVGAQITLWTWDGSTAVPQLTREYFYTGEQSAGTRLEGDLLKVQQKKQFRAFLVCGSCEGRQVDWTVRVTPRGLEDLGETSAVPEVDAVDELLYRVIHRQPAAGVASPAAIRAARKLIDESRKQNPSFGFASWKVIPSDPPSVCLVADNFRPSTFLLRRQGGKFFVMDVVATLSACNE